MWYVKQRAVRRSVERPTVRISSLSRRQSGSIEQRDCHSEEMG